MAAGTYVELPPELKERLKLIAQTGRPQMTLRETIIVACEAYCAKILGGISDLEETLERIRAAKAGAMVGMFEE